jgi:hypothetical protein
VTVGGSLGRSLGRSLFAAAWALAASLQAPAVSAQASPPARVQVLPPDDRFARLLVDSLQDPRLRAAAGDATARPPVDELLVDLAPAGTWELAGLLSLFPDGLEPSGWLPPPLSKALAGCAAQLGGALQRAGELDGARFLRACPQARRTLPDRSTLLIIEVPSATTEAAVVSRGAKPRIQLFERVAVEDRNLRLVVVPWDTALVLVVAGAGADRGLPTVQTFATARSPLEALPLPPRSSCIDVDVVADPGKPATLYLDGIRVPSARGATRGSLHLRLPVSEAEHTVHVLTDRPAYVRHLALADLSQAHGCKRLRIDARQSDAILLGDISVNDSCWQAGIDRNTVRAVAEPFLRKTGKFRAQMGDLPAILGAATQALQRSSTVGQQPTAFDKGHLDTTTNLAALGAELLSGGFGKLIIMDVQCSKQRLDGGWSVTFVARQLNAQLAAAALSVLKSGGDLKEVADQIVETNLETAANEMELAGSVERALAPLVRRPTVAFEGPAQMLPDVDGEKIQISGYHPDGDVAGALGLRMKRVKTTGDRARCERANGAARLETKPEPGPGLDDLQAIQCDVERGHGFRGLCKVIPETPGQYLLELRMSVLAGKTTEHIRAYRCVRTRSFDRPAVWAQASFGATSLKRPSPDARPQDFDHTAVLAGVELGRSALAVNWLTFSGVIGYARASHKRWTPPSWTDVAQAPGAAPGAPPGPVPDHDAQGNLPHRYYRDSILIGPAFAAKVLRLGWWDCLDAANSRVGASGIDVKLLPVVDLGWFSLDESSERVADVEASAGGLDLDLSSFFQVDLSLALSPTTRLSIGAHLGVLGILDEVFKDVRTTRRKVTDSVTLFWGVVVGGSTSL